MPKGKRINRIVVVIEQGIVSEVAADAPEEIEITIVDKDYHSLDIVTRAPDGEKAIVEEYPVEHINADHDKWLLSNPKINMLNLP